MNEDYNFPYNVEDFIDRIVEKAINRHKYYCNLNDYKYFHMVVAPCITQINPETGEFEPVDEEEIGCESFNCSKCALNTYVTLFNSLGLEEYITEEDKDIHDKV